jgi:hypothetical protein
VHQGVELIDGWMCMQTARRATLGLLKAQLPLVLARNVDRRRLDRPPI